MPQFKPWERIAHLSGRQRQIVALVCTCLAAVWIQSFPYQPWIVRISELWLIYAGVLLLTMWCAILLVHPAEIKRRAALLDMGQTLIFTFILLAAVASLLAMVKLLHSPAGAFHDQWWFLLLVVTVSWLLVHTIFAMHYAHMYYYGRRADGSSGKGWGLEFPEENRPDYIDFAYFSFCLGMTFQVSDVQISSRSIRRLAFLHALIAFLFNTFILAMMVNLLAGKL
ncbi:putative membrane protein [Thermoflavifilum aggregans]|uniref:Putative membrane protein n=1 Tax=Thermoflavifilum aggregans TaxID=454188 RepID=A0A2M9CXG9_9BACT|nr:DUF1345 domain-containing protein [Thermoflavifilum aggregans]PJJ76508.1 putative membrane protein [Thermoflavifilum aggregans]